MMADTQPPPQRRPTRLWKWLGVVGAVGGVLYAIAGLVGPDRGEGAEFAVGYLIGHILIWGLIGAALGFVADQTI